MPVADSSHLIESNIGQMSPIGHLSSYFWLIYSATCAFLCTFSNFVANNFLLLSSSSSLARIQFDCIIIMISSIKLTICICNVSVWLVASFNFLTPVGSVLSNILSLSPFNTNNNNSNKFQNNTSCLQFEWCMIMICVFCVLYHHSFSSLSSNSIHLSKYFAYICVLSSHKISSLFSSYSLKFSLFSCPSGQDNETSKAHKTGKYPISTTTSEQARAANGILLECSMCLSYRNQFSIRALKLSSNELASSTCPKTLELLANTTSPLSYYALK